MAENYVSIKIKADDTAKPDLTDLKLKLDELGHKVETAKVDVDDEDGKAKLLALNAKLATLNQRVANPRIKVAGAARAEADIAAVEAGLKHLNDQTDKLDQKAQQNSSGGGLLGKILTGAKDKGGPAWLGPVLGLAPAITSLGGVAAGAAVGVGGAFATAGAATAAYGLVAKSVLSQAATAANQVQAAQIAYTAAVANGAKQASAYRTEQTAIAKAYAQMSPAQIGLSKEIGGMSDQWAKFKQSVTPMIAGSLQPWLESVRTAIGELGSVLTPMAPVVHDLGVQFETLMTSSTMRSFMTWIGQTGATVTRSFGNALIDLLTGVTFLLPQFTSLMTGAASTISRWGDAFVKWASSKKAADEIHNFLQWFHDNGPAVTGFLKSVGGALKALIPGLAQGGIAALNALSSFFGMIAKLPPGLAKPLEEVAGALLVLNKLGVLSVGVKLVGMGGKAGAGAGAAEGAGGWLSQILPGIKMIGGVATVVLGVQMVLKNTSSGKGKNWWENPFGQGTFKDPKTGKMKGTPTALTSWQTFGHDIMHYWDMVWQNVVGRAGRGVHDVAGWFDSLRHSIAGKFDSIRHDIAAKWDSIWQATVGRVIRGVGDVRNWFARLPGMIIHGLGNLGNLLVNAGGSIISGLISGIENKMGDLGSVLGSVGSFIIQHKGPPSKDRTLLYENGQLIMQGLSGGLRSGLPGLHSTLTGVTSAIQGGVRPGAGGAGGGGTLKVQLEFVGGDDMLLRGLRNAIRVKGGNVQQVLGAR